MTIDKIFFYLQPKKPVKNLIGIIREAYDKYWHNVSSLV